MIRKIARPMLASAFVASGADMVMNSDEHRDGTKEMLTKLRSVVPAQYASYIPNDPDMVTKALGGAQAASASLLALGKAPRLTSAALAAITIPTVLSRYAFWETQDAKEKQDRRNGLITNTALLGGLMIASADTQGKPGLQWRAEHAGKAANKKIQAALPTKSEQEKIADKVTGYIDDAAKYFDDNKDDWLARAQKNSEVAKHKFVQVAATAQERAQELQKVAAEEAGRAQKKASKQAAVYQKKADKATVKAQKKLKKYDI
ncbi:DoxX [Corynebacterium kalinowskii]|uniref:DoxX n=1 Tax=Corynebacterium kalinowskii TaxID=2675216 RepID=A0A6B8VQ04_9CORY|nr:DoxX family protein [Corynebacterium kalinowskii]QGU01891.1 DoxX [Corynebacterium kalinowskii]